MTSGRTQTLLWITIAVVNSLVLAIEAIKEQPELMYEHTNNANCIAIVTDGTRVLGLGDIALRYQRRTIGRLPTSSSAFCHTHSCERSGSPYRADPRRGREGQGSAAALSSTAEQPGLSAERR
jgi:hypothetical protein